LLADPPSNETIDVFYIKTTFIKMRIRGKNIRRRGEENKRNLDKKWNV